MEGLEVSEVKFSYVSLNDVFRLDSNYFQKIFLKSENLIKSKKFKSLKSANAELRSFGAYSLNNHVHYLDDGVPFIRGVNMKNSRITFTDMIYIDKCVNSLLWKSEIKPEMVLLSMSGTIGDVAIASRHWNYPINSNQDIAKIDTRGEINPYFLYVFLASKFGQYFLNREARGSVQQHVFLSQIEQLEIPIFTALFDKKIQHCVEHSDQLIAVAEKCYEKSEKLFLKTVGLIDFNPNTKAVNIKSFKDSFRKTGRLDAEYFQPKYEDWAHAIQVSKHGSSTLAGVCEVKDHNFTPEENKTYAYIELSDIDKVGGITGATVAVGSELPTRARRLVKTGDVLVSSIEGSLSSCALVSRKYNNALCSTGFYVLRSNKLNSETLLVLMKSTPMQALLKQGCSGTILTAINNEAFLNLHLPLIDTKTQQIIASLVQESFQLRAKSEHLLDVAKRAVEIAIEEDEQAGLEYIQNNGLF